MNFKVDQARCIQCKLCVTECPVLIIDGKTEFPQIKEEKEEQCIKCQHCLAVCPTAAISIWGKNPEESLLVNDKIPQAAEMEQLIKTRRSVRKFTKEEVDKKLIHKLIETAAYAPTSHNQNAISFTVVDDKANVSKLRMLVYELIKRAHDEGWLPDKLAFMNNFQRLWFSKQIDILFRDAPHILIASASKTSANPNTDAVIALTYFELFANSNGLGTLWNGFLKWAINDISPEIRKAIGIPEDHVIVEVLLFGIAAVKFSRAIQNDSPRIKRVSL